MPIEALFALREDRMLIGHLTSFDWEFGKHGRVVVRAGQTEVMLRYVGSGNHEGEPAVMLVPLEAEERNVADIREALVGEGSAISIDHDPVIE